MCVCVAREMRAHLSVGDPQHVLVWRRFRGHRCFLLEWRERSPYWPKTCTCIRYTHKHTLAWVRGSKRRGASKSSLHTHTHTLLRFPRLRFDCQVFQNFLSARVTFIKFPLVLNQTSNQGGSSSPGCLQASRAGKTRGYLELTC